MTANTAPILDTGLIRVDSIDEDTSTINVPGGYFISGMSYFGGATVDADGDPVGIAITGLTGVVDGTVEISTDGGTNWFTVSAPVSESNALLLAANDLLRYTPLTDDNGDRIISFHAWDGTGGLVSGNYADITSVGTGGTTPFSTDVATHTLTITPVNDAPVLDNNVTRQDFIVEDTPTSDVPGGYFISGMSYYGGASEDADGNPIGIAITGVTGVVDGTVEISKDGGNTWFTVTDPVSESHALLLAANDLLHYTPLANHNGDRIISFHAWDGTGGGQSGDYADITSVGTGGTTPFSSAIATHTLTIIPDSDNVAPVLDINLAKHDFINEDSSTPETPGNYFVSGASFDADGDAIGIAITGLSGNAGTVGGLVEISRDGGCTWLTATEPVSESNALLLAATDLLHYTPLENANGDRTITFHAWDGTGGFISGDYADLTYNTDGSSPFSQVTGTHTLTINPVDDAPVFANSIVDQYAVQNKIFTFTIPANTFVDVDSDLTYTATMDDGETALPDWLHFDAATQTFSGTPTIDELGEFNVKVTATGRDVNDSLDGGISVSDTFTMHTNSTFNYDAILRIADVTTDVVDIEDYSIGFENASTSVAAYLQTAENKIDQFTLGEPTSITNNTTLHSETYISGDDSVTSSIKGTALNKLFGGAVTTGTASITEVKFHSNIDGEVVDFKLSTSGTGLVINFSNGNTSGSFTGMTFTTPWLEVKALGTLSFADTILAGGNNKFALNANLTELSLDYPLDDYGVKLKGNISYNQSETGFSTFSGSLTEFEVDTPFSELVYKGKLSYTGDSDGAQTVTGAVTEISLTGADNVTFSLKGDINFSAAGALSGVVNTLNFTEDGQHYEANGLNANILMLFNADGSAKDFNGDGFINAGDLKSFVLAGNDFILGSSYVDPLNDGINILDGGSGADYIDGAGGNDTLTGGTGADNFVLHLGSVDNITDFNMTEGDVLDLSQISPLDTVNFVVDPLNSLNTLVQVFDGESTFDVAILEGVAFDDPLLPFSYITTGPHYVNAINLTANKADVLNGVLPSPSPTPSANHTTDDIDIINGGVGADSMTGLGGNDIYIVDNVSDKTIEALEGGDADEVRSSVSYKLAANVENLMLYGDALSNISGTGNDDANVIIGDAGNNLIDGGLGKDTMVGGYGDDTYIVDDHDDVITEYGNQGIDTAKVKGVSYTLSNGVENALITSLTAGSLDGNDLNNSLTGNNGIDTLTGGNGDDTLIGGAGADILQGNEGSDDYFIDINDILTEAGTGLEDKDTIHASFAIDLNDSKYDGIENVTLLGAAVINATGDEYANALTGNSAANILDGKEGADAMNGGKGADTYIVDDLGDTVTEELLGDTDLVKSKVSFTLGANVDNLTLTDGTDTGGTDAIDGVGNGLANTIIGNAGNNYLAGNDGIDTLTGNDGDDTLNGGAGNDKMSGGKGDDLYIIDSKKDVVTESFTELDGGGIDTIQSSVTRQLGNNFENLTLTGSGNGNGVGNELNNIINGNNGKNALVGGKGDDTLDGGAGNDTLDGSLGVDSLTGGSGDDTYLVDLVKDGDFLIIQDSITGSADEGIDTISLRLSSKLLSDVSVIDLDALGYSDIENLDAKLSGTANVWLTGNALNNTLTGNAAANYLAGGAGNDTLDGGKGEDTLDGGSGDDTYMITAQTEIEGEIDGNDTVIAAFSLELSQFNGIENITLLGAAIKATGDDVGNYLTGNSAANILDGQGGDDTMQGGNGADTYFVDSEFDSIIEESAIAKTGGVDLVKAKVSFTLQDNVENLTLTDGTPITGGTDSINGTGNDLANTIIGNAGDNYLAGNDGNDTLTANDGNDTLDGGAGNDKMNGGKGDDLYIVDAKLDVVTESFTFVQGGGTDTVESSITFTLLANFENLTLTGVGNINGAGNALANTIIGNDGNNALNGGANNDNLTGGLGNDIFTFNSILNATTNVDTITDFASGEDLFKLSTTIFTKLKGDVNGLSDNFYEIGGDQDSNDFIAYNSSTGELYYDANGLAAGDGTLFATLGNTPTLTGADFILGA